MPPHPSTTRDGFAARLAEAAAFKDTHGRLPRPSRTTAVEGELALGAWLRRKHLRRIRGTLPAHERAALDEALGPWWILGPAAAQRAEHRHRA